MSNLINEWQIKLDEVEQARKAADEAGRLACMVEVPEKLRPAEAKDIIEGAIIWYPEYRDISDEKYPCAGWMLVREPLHYGDPYKAFTANDGCRYGLDGAFVEL